MANLGTVVYYDAKTRRRLPDVVKDVPPPRRAPPGRYAVWTSADDGGRWYFDERGRLEAWAVAALKLAAGRPARGGKASDVRVTVRITPEERARWEHSAGDASLGEWIRRRCNEAVGR